MVDLYAQAPRHSVATSAPSPMPAGPPGFPRLAALERYAMLMDGGPTGASRYWPEWFAFVHPELATTDVSLNLVDEVWLSDRGQTMWILLPQTPLLPSIAETLREIRDTSGLSASDVAAMLGVKRRRLYDLLGGAPSSPERERWIQVLAGLIGDLTEAARADTARVRAALLRPDDSGTTLFDLAVAHDEPAARERAAMLCSELRQGRITGRVQRPSPTLKRRSRSSAASDFLFGYREREDERT
jgi:transcriptional regulator with XRE-family HTH domain